ncbi:MAG: hypothetical protein ACLPSW_12870 [Roseiarcus sp.]
MAWFSPFVTALWCGAYLVSHVIVAGIALAAVKATKWLVGVADHPKLFDLVSIEYLFDAMDLGILAAFFILGTREVVWVLKARANEQKEGLGK